MAAKINYVIADETAIRKIPTPILWVMTVILALPAVVYYFCSAGWDCLQELDRRSSERRAREANSDRK